MANRFGIELTQTDREAHPGKMMVELPDFEVRTQTDLPFADEMTLGAVLKALEARGGEVNRGNFYEAELDWLCQEGLVITGGERSFYATDMRERVGRKLFECLFQDKALFAKYDQVRRARVDEGVDFELRFGADDTLVGALPWELLHNDHDFLCGGGRGTLVRYVTFDAPPPDWQPPAKLKALVVSPKTADLPPLGSAELQAIQAAHKAGRLSVAPLKVPTFAALEDYLRRNSLPQIIHFDGHGVFGRRCWKCGKVTDSRKARNCCDPSCNQPLLDARPQGYLVFEDVHGYADYVSAQRFADLLRETQVSRKDGSRILLVTLNACRSGVARGGESVFNGVAQRLMDARIPAVVATQFSILDSAAQEFARSLYQGIAAGDPLRKAVSWGRTTLGRDSDRGGDQWYRPVLYLRWRDNAGGDLFGKGRSQSRQAPPPERKQEFVPPPASLSSRTGSVRLGDKVKVAKELATGSIERDDLSGDAQTGDIVIGQGTEVRGAIRTGDIRSKNRGKRR